MNDVNTATRKQPQQKRALQRRQQILDISADILQEQGLERFNTAIVSERLGISIGSLYRYFPNKQSILYTLAEQWLQANSEGFDEIWQWPLEQMPLSQYVNDICDLFAEVYKKESQLTLILVVILEVPELKELINDHDEMIIKQVARHLQRLNVAENRPERRRLSEIIVGQVHYGLLLMLEQGPRMAKRTQDDLKMMFLALLQKHAD